MLILFFFRQDAEPIGVGTGAPDTDLRHLEGKEVTLRAIVAGKFAFCRFRQCSLSTVWAKSSLFMPIRITNCG